MNTYFQRSLITVVALATLLAHAASAGNYYVATTGNDTNTGTSVAPFRTIAKGIIAAAANGDTILVANGTYNEHDLDFGTKNLVLKSQSGTPAACILDCQQLGNGFLVAGGQTFAMTISGLTVRNAIDLGNTNGGASTLYISNGSATITDCIFTNNNSSAANGLHMGPGGSATITNCTFSTTVAQASAGSVVAARGQNLTMTNCNFSGNGCGSLELSAGDSTIKGCNFSGNTLDSGGGAGVGVHGGNHRLTSCSFTNNTAWYGGGIYQNGGVLVADKCVLTGNLASEPDIGGGGLYASGGDLTLSNCIFANNQIWSSSDRINGASMCLEADGDPFPAKVVNCTFVGDWTGSFPIANIVVYRTTLTVVNSIIWGPNFGDIYVNLGGVATVTHSNLWYGRPGTGNISADPVFVNSGLGNYHLTAGSPCRNTGNFAAIGLPETDMDGVPRILGSAPDMGAYETWNAASGVWFVDAALGNDAAPGSPGLPYKTVGKAITVAAAGNSIYIKAGNYGTDKPRITKALSLHNWRDTGLSRIGQP